MRPNPLHQSSIGAILEHLSGTIHNQFGATLEQNFIREIDDIRSPDPHYSEL